MSDDWHESTHTLRDGRTLVVREAAPPESAALLAYLEQVAGESDNLTFGPGEFEMSVEQEEAFLQSCHESPLMLYIAGYVDDEVVATLHFGARDRPRLRHIGELGMTVRKPYWGLGIGAILLDTLIAWARGDCPISKINLQVRTDNESAIRLYERKGFVHEGTITRAMLTKGEYVNNHCMGLSL